MTTAAPTLDARDASLDVVTSASSSWADAGTIVTGGSVDGEALRVRHRARIAADRGPVTVVRDGSPRELGQKVCEASVPKRPAETPILLKPNLGGFEWFRDPAKNGGDDGLRGRITDPEFVRGILRCLKARGHTRITVAEGWGARHEDWEHLIRASGYLDMTKEEGVPLVAMDDDGVFDVEGDRPGKPLQLTGMEKTRMPTLLVAKILAEHLEHGLFISVPKIKAHRFGVASVAIKGMQGTVMTADAAPAFRQKWRSHRELGPALEKVKKGLPEARVEYIKSLELFAERMTDVLEVFAPDVVLADGGPAVGGDGFGKQWARPESFAVGGTNPILVDRVAIELLGLWKNDALAKELGGHSTSPLLTTAATRFGVSLDGVEVVGNGKDLLGGAQPVHFVSMAGFELHSDATPAAIVASAASSAATSVPDAHAKPEGDAASAPPSADPSHPWWKAAPLVRFDTDTSGAKTGVATEVRFLYSKEKALRVLFRVEDVAGNTDTSRPSDKERERLYEEDCVELFLAPDPAKRTAYAEIELGPHSHFFDLWIDRSAKTSDAAWSSVPTIATRRDPTTKVAFIEARFTAPELTRAAVPGARLPIGIFRMDGFANGNPKRRYLAFSPAKTKTPNFHVPDAFATLVFDP